MITESKYSIGLRYGLITGFSYAVLIFLRYLLFASSPRSFYFLAMVSYLFVLFMYLLTGMARKKELGPSVELKSIFQSIFIAILITEFLYVIFNFVYLKFINPGFLENFQKYALDYYKKLNYTPEQMDLEMQGIRTLSDALRPAGLLKGFGTYVVMDSIFGFAFAALLNRKRP